MRICTPLRNWASGLGSGYAFYLYPVFLFDVLAQPMLVLPGIIGQQEQAFAVFVQTSDGINVGWKGKQIVQNPYADHRISKLAQYAKGLVHEEIAVSIHAASYNTSLFCFNHLIVHPGVPCYVYT